MSLPMKAVRAGLHLKKSQFRSVDAARASVGGFDAPIPGSVRERAGGPVFVAGDSAGGGLAPGLAQQPRDHREAEPSALLLFPDARRLAAKAQAAGTTVRLSTYPEAVHVFAGLPFLPESRDAPRRRRQRPAARSPRCPGPAKLSAQTAHRS